MEIQLTQSIKKNPNGNMGSNNNENVTHIKSFGMQLNQYLKGVFRTINATFIKEERITLFKDIFKKGGKNCHSELFFSHI